MKRDSAAAKLSSVAGPDVDELRQFYDRVFDEVHGYAIRLTGGDAAGAEDLVHEAFVGLVRAWRDGRVTRLEVGWLIIVVRQRFLDGVRRRARESRRLRAVAAQRPAAVDETFEPDEAMTLLGHLPERARAALVLRYVDDMTVQGVASAMGMSVHATESLLARGRRQLSILVKESRNG